MSGLRMPIESALHRIDDVLLLPSGDSSLLPLGAILLDGVMSAGVGAGADGDKSNAWEAERVMTREDVPWMTVPKAFVELEELTEETEEEEEINYLQK